MEEGATRQEAIDCQLVPESEIARVAEEISNLGSREQGSIYHLSWWSDRLLEWAMANQSFKTQLFRFVDTFASLTDDSEITEYLEQYLGSTEMPKLVDFGLGLAGHIPGGDRLSAAVTKRNVIRMAHQFIMAENESAAAEKVTSLWRSGLFATVDLLGEHTFTRAEAQTYASRLESLIEHLADASASWDKSEVVTDRFGEVPKLSVSVKSSALTSHFSPLQKRVAITEIAQRLREPLRLAERHGFSVYIDMESFETKGLVWELFEELALDPALSRSHLGIVVQAYLQDSEQDLRHLISLSSARETPLNVRLVKGAYWDTEVAIAESNGWDAPVYTEKQHSDANFERCAQFLHANSSSIRYAFASHNLRSLAHAIASAEHCGLGPNEYELQLLYGMAQPVHNSLVKMGHRVRLYCPVGALIPGMAYLVRRLLENTSNESFVRHRFAEHQSLSTLLTKPELPRVPRRPAEGSEVGYRPEPPAEFRLRPNAERFSSVLSEVRGELGSYVAGLADGMEISPASIIDSIDPADNDRLVATAGAVGADGCKVAIAAVVRSAPDWGSTSVEDRCAVLVRAAQWLRERRERIAATEVFEVGKTWADADADVCEAIDYLEYYASQAAQLSSVFTVQSPIGETNKYLHRPKGPGLVICPWNFPLAIPMGMTSAALVMGNTVLVKPAEQSVLTTSFVYKALTAAGLPEGVLSYLPGIGEEIGPPLVSSPEIAFISFTGSRQVGLSINEAAAKINQSQRHVKKVVAEMGGKNAIIVAKDADPDEALDAVLKSAFGFAGQKCSAASRVIVVGSIYKEFCERLRDAISELVIGHPESPETQMGPLIDDAAFMKIIEIYSNARKDSAHLARIAGEGASIHFGEQVLPHGGYFVHPAVFTGVDPESMIAQEELFAPVLSVMKASTIEGAVKIANLTPYALTAGLISRSPRDIAYATEALRAGNVYINRAITGAVVGRQPFGGWGMSGVGSKAGGPEYLLQFSNPKVVTENTVRHGFVPPPGENIQ